MALALDRLDFRLDKDEKELIELAAKQRGMKTSAYARSVLLAQSKKIVIEAQAASAVLLSRQEARRFMDALAAPFQPNAKLARAMERAKVAN